MGELKRASTKRSSRRRLGLDENENSDDAYGTGIRERTRASKSKKKTTARRAEESPLSNDSIDPPVRRRGPKYDRDGASDDDYATHRNHATKSGKSSKRDFSGESGDPPKKRRESALESDCEEGEMKPRVKSSKRDKTDVMGTRKASKRREVSNKVHSKQPTSAVEKDKSTRSKNRTRGREEDDDNDDSSLPDERPRRDRKVVERSTKSKSRTKHVSSEDSASSRSSTPSRRRSRRRRRKYSSSASSFSSYASDCSCRGCRKYYFWHPEMSSSAKAKSPVTSGAQSTLQRSDPPFNEPVANAIANVSTWKKEESQQNTRPPYTVEPTEYRQPYRSTYQRTYDNNRGYQQSSNRFPPNQVNVPHTQGTVTPQKNWDAPRTARHDDWCDQTGWGQSATQPSETNPNNRTASAQNQASGWGDGWVDQTGWGGGTDNKAEVDKSKGGGWGDQSGWGEDTHHKDEIDKPIEKSQGGGWGDQSGWGEDTHQKDEVDKPIEKSQGGGWGDQSGWGEDTHQKDEVDKPIEKSQGGGLSDQSGWIGGTHNKDEIDKPIEKSQGGGWGDQSGWGEDTHQKDEVDKLIEKSQGGGWGDQSGWAEGTHTKDEIDKSIEQSKDETTADVHEQADANLMTKRGGHGPTSAILTKRDDDFEDGEVEASPGGSECVMGLTAVESEPSNSVADECIGVCARGGLGNETGWDQTATRVQPVAKEVDRSFESCGRDDRNAWGPHGDQAVRKETEK